MFGNAECRLLRFGDLRIIVLRGVCSHPDGRHIDYGYPLFSSLFTATQSN